MDTELYRVFSLVDLQYGNLTYVRVSPRSLRLDVS